jgi:predicted permease
VLEITAPVFLLAAAGFIWVKLGFEYRTQFVTRLAMTLAVPCLIFTALMQTDLDKGALGTFMLAALAGLVFAARLNTATPKAGVAFELDVIAAVFIGGASMSGGVGTVVGAVVGAFIMGVMNNGMSILGIGIDWQQVIKGVVLLAAVIFDVLNKQKG